MIASTSKAAKAQTNKKKSLTLSLSSHNDDIIEINDSLDSPTNPAMPKVNLHNQLIDLTNSPSMEIITRAENISQGKDKIQKTIHLNMELSAGPSCSSSMLLRSTSKSNLSRPRADEPGPSIRIPRVRPSINEPCYKKLQEMMDKPLIANYEDFVCVLCSKYIKKGDGVVLKECLHSFCRCCLNQVLNTVTPGMIRVDCPNVPEICESYISMEEIRAILEDKFEEFVSKMGNENSTEDLLPILIHMDDLAVIPNIKAFECQVCFSDVGIGEGILLKNCLHNGCKECLVQLINHAEEFEVPCPFVEREKGCKEYIQEKEMRYLLSEADFDKHIKKSLKVAEFVNEMNFHCRGLDCENFVELIEGITSFVCEVCKVLNCVPCKAVHPGKSCREFQEDANPNLKNARLQNEIKQSEEAIAKEISAGTAMLCPRCQIPVMKITGCDYITCTACKLGICWITRKPRKAFKRGNGETVEGCKCKEAPLMKRCHPKCGNCH